MQETQEQQQPTSRRQVATREKPVALVARKARDQLVPGRGAGEAIDLPTRLELPEEGRQEIARLHETIRLIDRERAGLQHALATRDEFTQIVLDGNGPDAICAHLGRLVSTPAAITDRAGHVISAQVLDGASRDQGWDEMIADGRVPAALNQEPAVIACIQAAERGGIATRLRPLPALGYHHSRVLAPVTLNQGTAAYLWALEWRGALNAADLATVEQAALALAIWMMKERAVAQALHKRMGDVVAALLDGKDEPKNTLLSQAVCLGIDMRLPKAVLVVGLDEATGMDTRRQAEKKQETTLADLLGAVERGCALYAPGAMVSTKGDQVIVLAGLATTGDADQRFELRELADSIRAAARGYLRNVSVCVGIGAPSGALSGLAESYRQACLALSVARSCGQSDQTVDCDHLGICGLLFDPPIMEKLVPAMHETLKALLDYDRRRGTDLTLTLNQYLLHDCHLSQTAAAMNVHIGTVRYRVRNIEQILGIDLHEADVRFNLQLALKVWQALTPEGTADGHAVRGKGQRATMPVTKHGSRVLAVRGSAGG